jgi:hypothetical protein
MKAIERTSIRGFDLFVYDIRPAPPAFQAWLNTECEEFDGLCIGAGATVDEALADAVSTVETIEGVMQGPRPWLGRVDRDSD